MKIINKSNNNILADRATIANTAFARMKGLLGRKELSKGEALILDPCNSIHMLFMRFPIDVLFVDKNSRVVKTIFSIKPFQLTRVYFKAKFAIELPSGTILSTSTKEQDPICIAE